MTMDLSPVTVVSVEWILKNVTSSIDVGNVCSDCGSNPWYCSCGAGIDVPWEHMLDYKLDDCDWSFIESILNNGIVAPICLTHHESFNGDYLEFGNGHHRMTIAILAMLENVPVVFAFDGDYMHTEVTQADDVPDCSGYVW